MYFIFDEIASSSFLDNNTNLLMINGNKIIEKNAIIGEAFEPSQDKHLGSFKESKTHTKSSAQAGIVCAN